MRSVTNVNNMVIPKFTLNWFIFIVFERWLGSRTFNMPHPPQEYTRKKGLRIDLLWSEGVQTTY